MQNTDMGVAFFSGTTDTGVAKYRLGRYFFRRNALVISTSGTPKEKVNMLYQEKQHHGGKENEEGTGADDVFSVSMERGRDEQKS